MTHKILMAIFVAATILCGSCTIVRTTTTTDNTADNKPAITESTTSEQPRSKRKAKKKKKSKEPKSSQESPQQFASNQARLSEQVLSGRWNIYSIDNHKVKGSDELWPYIDFSVSENRFYGSNGCNYINGSFKVSSGQQIIMTDILSSLMECPDDQYGPQINSALNNVKSYSLEQRGNEYFLHLHNSRHNTVITLRKHNLDFLNGAWMVKEMEGIPCNNPDIRMVIDIPEQRIHGNTGCNILNGVLSEDPVKPNSIQFHEIMTTRMACQNLAQETAFLIALEEVVYAFKSESGDTVELRNKHNKTVLILAPIKR